MAISIVASGILTHHGLNCSFQQWLFQPACTEATREGGIQELLTAALNKSLWCTGDDGVGEVGGNNSWNKSHPKIYMDIEPSLFKGLFPRGHNAFRTLTIEQ